MNGKLRILLALVGCLLILLVGKGHELHFVNSNVDVSWPNCSLKAADDFNSGVIGVTGGLDFSPNPCLAQETTWFQGYSLYMNSGYPGKSYGIKFASYPSDCSHTNYDCLAFNYGYNAAQYAIKYSYTQVAHSSIWWIDVEIENSWTANPLINRSVLSGAIDALKQMPFVSQIGIYSTAYQWNLLTSYWQNKLPVWIGTGSMNKKAALDACDSVSFTGGPVLLTQYTQKLDTDVSCPR